MEIPRKRILIIDDEPMICELLECVLENLYEVQTKNDSVQGLEAARISPPDLILCDLTMPGLSGATMIARLLTHPSTADVPVLLVSGDVSVYPDSPEWKHIAGVLQKPFSPAELLESVARALARSAGQTPGCLAAA